LKFLRNLALETRSGARLPLACEFRLLRQYAFLCLAPVRKLVYMRDSKFNKIWCTGFAGPLYCCKSARYWRESTAYNFQTQLLL